MILFSDILYFLVVLWHVIYELCKDTFIHLYLFPTLSSQAFQACAGALFCLFIFPEKVSFHAVPFYSKPTKESRHVYSSIEILKVRHNHYFSWKKLK